MSGRRSRRARAAGVGPGKNVPDNAAATYVRVSTVGQVDGFSLEYQREKTMALIEKLGLFVASEHAFEEVDSGANPYREAFGRLTEAVEAGDVRHVVVYRSDRVARDELVMVQFSRLCQSRGVKLYFVDGTRVETDLDVTVQFLMGWHGRVGKDEIARQTMDGKERAARNNRLPNGTGAGLMGYDYDPVEQCRTVNEGEAAVVRQAFEWRIGGANFSQIARWLNEKGLKAKKGGPFTHGTVGTMIANQAYTGSQYYGKKRYERVFEKDGPKRRVTDKPVEEWIALEGFTPMLIDPADWEAAQGVRPKRVRKGIEWDYVLTEFSYCGECPSNVNGGTETANGRSRKFSYPYYRCRGTMGDEYRPRICDLEGFRADKLEPVVLEHIMAVVDNPEGFLAVVREEASGGGAKFQAQISPLERQLRKKGLEADKLGLQVSKGLMDQKRYERLVGPVNLMIERLEEELALLVAQRADSENWGVFEERVREALSSYKGGLSILDNEGRNRLMRLLNVRITYYHGRVVVTGELDPSLFTIAQTLASPRGRSYRQSRIRRQLRCRCWTRSRQSYRQA